MRERFVLSYQPFVEEEDERKLISFVANARGISDWTHPFVGCFLFVTEADIRTVFDLFADYFGELGNFVISSNTEAPYAGRFLQDTVKWLQKYSTTVENLDGEPILPVSDDTNAETH